MNVGSDTAARTPSSFGAGILRALLIDVAFDAIADPVERRYFTELPTTFSLSAEVDRLREIGGRLLRESWEYKRLLCSLGAPSCIR